MSENKLTDFPTTVRDNWESKKADLEKELSEIMGTPWTVEFNPLELYPYATDSRGKEALGDLMSEYVIPLRAPTHLVIADPHRVG